MTPGIHLVHKPIGPTSHSVVESLRGEARETKMCHGGALDPFASGLLLILVEPATKLFRHLHDIPKAYDATVRWGVETDNGDPTGEPVYVKESFKLTSPQLDEELEKRIGWQGQTPPATSNKRLADGERAYVKAHRGEAVEMTPVVVYMHEARWLRHDFVSRESKMRIVVRGGYYVRALARDMGRALGCGAHLTTLHRTAIGPWNDPGPGAQREVHGRDLIPWLPVRILTDQEVGELRQERDIDAGAVLRPDWPRPDGFPASSPDYVRGFHLDRFAFILRHYQSRLFPVTALPGKM